MTYQGLSGSAVGAHRFDGVSALTLVLLPLFLFPSRLKVIGLGGVGSPSTLLSLALLGWWIIHQVARSEVGPDLRHPVRIAVGFLLLSFGLSYVAVLSRPSAIPEVSTATLGLISLLGWAGVALVAHDGIPDSERLLVLGRRLTWAGAFLATVGLAQFFSHQILIDRIHVPGLTTYQAIGDLGSRSGFNRPSGTALHAIEFGAALTMLIPLALNQALFDRHRSWIARWYPVACMSFAVTVAISRTAVIGAVVGILAIMPGWPRQVRLIVALSSPFVALFFFVTVPGLLGAIAGMFTGLGGDASARSRVDSYPLALAFIERAPLIGRGFSTFLPNYRILDNQYLLLLIEVGVLGTLALAALFISSALCARAGSLAAETDNVRQLGRALFAGVLVGAISNAFYDGLSFPLASSILFMEVGMCGALYRLVRQRRLISEEGPSNNRAPLAGGSARPVQRSPSPTAGVHG